MVLRGIWRKENRILLGISLSIMLVSSACSHENKEKKQADKKSPNQVVQTAKVEKETKKEKATPEKIKTAVFETLGFNATEGERKITNVVIDNENHIIIKFIPDANVNENLLSFSVNKDIGNILLGIKKSNVQVTSVQLISNQSSANQAGKVVQKEIADVTYSSETISKIDFESFNTDNIVSMADNVTYLDPALVRK